MERAGSFATSSEPKERMNELYRNIQHVFNGLLIRFRVMADSSRIELGWINTPWPQDITHPVRGRWIYLHNYQISTEPPQVSAKSFMR